MNYIILLRHGQSQWNLENKFTGLTNIGLTKEGIDEAIKAGKLINKLSIKIDKIYTSVLKRANQTAEFAMMQSKQNHLYNEGKLIMVRDKALNERDYGDLVGLNKADAAKKYGKKQVHIWRRSFDVNPPGGESLKEVLKRVDLYFNNNIKKEIKLNKNLLIAAHGNSLRALLICLKIYKPQEISDVEVPTGKPLVIKFNKEKLISFNYLS